MLCGPQIRTERGGEEKYFCPCRELNAERIARRDIQVKNTEM